MPKSVQPAHNHCMGTDIRVIKYLGKKVVIKNKFISKTFRARKRNYLNNSYLETLVFEEKYLVDALFSMSKWMESILNPLPGQKWATPFFRFCKELLSNSPDGLISKFEIYNIFSRRNKRKDWQDRLSSTLPAFN